MSMIVTIWRFCFEPRALFAEQVKGPTPALGLKAMGLLGLGFAILDLWLHFRGHKPTFTGNFIPAEIYYPAQAVFVTPWLCFCWMIYVLAARFFGRLAGGSGNSRAAFANLGMAYAFPVLFAYIIPDIVVFGLYGHYGMSVAMKIYGPICLLYTLTMGSIAIHVTEKLSLLRAVPVNFAAFLIQGIFAGLLIR